MERLKKWAYATFLVFGMFIAVITIIFSVLVGIATYPILTSLAVLTVVAAAIGWLWSE